MLLRVLDEADGVDENLDFAGGDAGTVEAAIRGRRGFAYLMI